MASSSQRPGHTDLYALFAVFLTLAWFLSIAAAINILFGLFLDINKDTNALSNTAFAVLGLIATALFNYAAALEANDPDRREVIQRGETFFFSATIFAAASLLKYAAIEGIRNPPGKVFPSELLAWMSAGCFGSATVIAYYGLTMLCFLLLRRRFNGQANP
jgi:hypothetical protein